MKNKFIPLLAAGLACAAAHAQDNLAKFGLIRYSTHSTSSGLAGPGVPPGGDAKTGDATTVIFVYERALTPNFSAEIVLGIPPRIKAKATGTVAFLGDEVLSAKNVSPTLLFNYNFGAPGDAWRPYLGAGINYTRFVGIRTSLPDTTVEMGDHWGPAVQAGINYAFDKQWGLFASIARVDTKTKVVAVSEGLVLSTKIDLRPVTYAAGVSYRF